MRLIDEHSWFPRIMKKFSGYLRAGARGKGSGPSFTLRWLGWLAALPTGRHAVASFRSALCRQRHSGRQLVVLEAGRGGVALDLVGEEEADALEALRATVDIVAQEKVVGLGGEPAVLEQAEQIGVLSVHIPHDL